jgi:hypothetical protein
MLCILQKGIPALRAGIAFIISDFASVGDNKISFRRRRLPDGASDEDFFAGGLYPGSSCGMMGACSNALRSLQRTSNLARN